MTDFKIARFKHCGVGCNSRTAQILSGNQEPRRRQANGQGANYKTQQGAGLNGFECPALIEQSNHLEAAKRCR
jgi:hypothetical protein